MRKTLAAVLLAAICLIPLTSDATVTSTTLSTAPVACNGVTVVFPFTFKVQAAADLVVTKTYTTTGYGTPLALTTDYLVTLDPTIGGTVTLVNGSRCPSTYTLTIARRAVPLTQTTAFSTSGAFSPKAHENAFDKLTMEVQQLDRTHADDKSAQTLRDAAQDASTAASLAAVRQDLDSAPGSTIDTWTVQSTGSSTARTLKDRFAEKVNVKDFGATGDCSTDDTASIQAAINAAAAFGGTVVFPPVTFSKCYKVTRLYLHYDVSANPLFPSTFVQSRGITLQGAGPTSDSAATSDTQFHGSVVVSTDATGPVFLLDGGAAYSARQTILDGLTIIGSTSTSLVSFDGANTGSEIRNCMLVQNGTGHGIDWLSIWGAGISNTNVLSGTNVKAAGSTGIRIRAELGGGEVNLDRTFVWRKWGATGGFDVGYQLGAMAGDAPYDAQNIVGVNCRLCTAQQVNKGMILARVRSATIDTPYFELTDSYAIKVTHRSWNVTIRNGYFGSVASSDGEIVIDSAGPGTELKGIEIVNNYFTQLKNYGIHFIDGTRTAGRIALNNFVRNGAGDGAGEGIHTGGFTTPWVLEDNYYDSFNGGGLTPYDDASGIQYRRDLNDSSIWMKAGALSTLTPLTANQVIATRVRAVSTGDMADQFGPLLAFQIQDTAGVANNIGFIGAYRSGADNTGAIEIGTYSAGVFSARFYVMADGKINIPNLTASRRVETDSNKYLVSKANAAAQADSTASDVAGLKADFNALLAKLRTAGLMAP